MKRAFVLALFFAVASAPVAAQNPDYVLSLTDIQGVPGTSETMSVFLENSGDPVQGYSFSLCHEAMLVTPTAATIGVDILALNGGSGPDFFFADQSDLGVQNIVVISIIGGGTLPAGFDELLLVDYFLEGPTGTVTQVDFCDTVGTPPTETVIVVNQMGEEPVQGFGLIELTGTPLPPGFLFRAPNASVIYDMVTGAGDFELSPTIEQTMGGGSPSLGFSMGLAHDPDFVIATFVEPAGPLVDLNGGTGPEFFVANILPDGVTVNVEYNLAGTETIIFGGFPDEVVNIQYTTNAGNLAGTSATIDTDLVWVDILGVPPVENLIEHGMPPVIEPPTTFDGTITLSTADYVLYISEEANVQGSFILPQFLLDAGGLAVGLAGWAWGVCHDDAFLDLLAVFPGSALATVNQGGPPDFYVTELFDEGWSLGCVVNFLSLDSLPPGAGYEMNTAEYQLVGPDNSTTDLVYCNSVGNPAVETVLVEVGGNTITPATLTGTQSIGVPPPPQPQFIRGDADGNGEFNGLVDGLLVLNFQFQGGPPPPCMEAADADSNATINGLVDGLYTLAHQFTGGPPPPAPFPLCGVDPDPAMSLGCNTPPLACNP